jgi:hypothetical protein
MWQSLQNVVSGSKVSKLSLVLTVKNHKFQITHNSASMCRAKWPPPPNARDSVVQSTKYLFKPVNDAILVSDPTETRASLHAGRILRKKRLNNYTQICNTKWRFYSTGICQHLEVSPVGWNMYGGSAMFVKTNDSLVPWRKAKITAFH